jgi:hypothetical protein
MDGPLAQIVALTCHGNALLRGLTIPPFFPANTTCTYVDSIGFAERRKRFLGKTREVRTAETADDWLAALPKRGATGIRLLRQPRNDPHFSDRMSAGLVGGGGTWMMQVLMNSGESEFWAARWEVWNQKAPGSRIWRVTYLLLARGQTRVHTVRDLPSIKRDVRVALTDIHSFSTRKNCEGYTECFADALHVLDDPDAPVKGIYPDIAPAEILNADAGSLLKAAMRAWVFGAMGSWNDMGFEGEAREEYEILSDQLFNVLTEAIAAAASSTASAPAVTSIV